MTIIARHLVISGHVQGVFFRAWTVETAKKLGLGGWVRNRANGDVEALVEGEEAAVLRFLDQARTGPPAARVDHVHIVECAPEAIRGFGKRATA
ncbi:MAG: acylphosphatase [Sphingobium sp.]